jgi:hypothetical protein
MNRKSSAVVAWLVAAGCTAQARQIEEPKIPAHEQVYVVARKTTAMRFSRHSTCSDVLDWLEQPVAATELDRGDWFRIAEFIPHWPLDGRAYACEDVVVAERGRSGNYWFVRRRDLIRPTVDVSKFAGEPGVDYGFIASVGLRRVSSVSLKALDLLDGSTLLLEDGQKAVRLSDDGDVVGLENGAVVLLDRFIPPEVRYAADYASQKEHFLHCRELRERAVVDKLPVLAVAGAPADHRGKLYRAGIDFRSAEVMEDKDGWLAVDKANTVAYRSGGPLDAPGVPYLSVLVEPTGRVLDLKLPKAVEVRVVAVLNADPCLHTADLVPCRFEGGLLPEGGR